ncbi:monovalent cation:H+ antiporter, CPA1 family [Paenibacillus catalpae]|uniref:Monovalent cation:H+ antiporter, CPA1 family n=1 Tax=Paenibacillus catalpae TaxID=1045775 RepID=A0A1I1VHI9_9BACL|nr:Na+/H+ antiporter [Paenibacillus catalpae]SFD82477.1 monovalent cation:H+ antiporter, CPA1 family [Paenibacillus catalpae]
MEIFVIVLVMLVLIGVSNVIYRYIPFIPVPLIQIVLGAVITVIPFGVHLHLEPELFFILFIAPLLYNDGKNTPRDELWRLRAPILLLSVGLVFVTVFVIGYTIHWMIPTIPLAAAFGLAAILSPTDAVAVGALAGRIQLPKSLMRLLEGEALMNDASGLVAFKFAVAAAMTGVFSWQKASFSFIVIAAGGLLVGAVLAFIIIGIRHLLRRAGLEDETMHMLLQLVTPFLLYLVAEELGVSGILAAVAGGIVHAIEDDRVDHSMPRLKSVSVNTWSVILFILNGLVFVILGLQIPQVTTVIFKDPGFNNLEVIGYAVIIFVLLLVLRFVWTFLFTWIGKDKLSFKVIILTTISGVRGAVTLAGAFSVPLLLNNGSPFPQRDLIIFLAAFIILLSLLTASILLPLIAKKRVIADETEQAHEEREWQMKVMGAAIRHLEHVSHEANEEAIESVIAEYRRMILQMEMIENQNRQLPSRRQKELEMRIIALDIERKYVDEQLEKGAISEKHANFYFKMLDQIELILANRLHLWRMVLKGLWNKVKASFNGSGYKLAFTDADITALRGLRLQCSEAVLEEMDARCAPEAKDDPTECVTAYYHQIISRMKAMPIHSRNKTHDFHEARKELHWVAIQAERDEVQSLYEKGTIDRELASTLRRHIRDREAAMYEEDEIG